MGESQSNTGGWLPLFFPLLLLLNLLPFPSLSSPFLPSSPHAFTLSFTQPFNLLQGILLGPLLLSAVVVTVHIVLIVQVNLLKPF